MSKTVLLTGVTGFLGSHTAIQLLEKGYQVTGTLRSMNRADSIRAVIAKHTSHVDQLTFVEADLLDREIWKKLMSGVTYVQHIASPFPRTMPKNDDELIEPAIQGTLSVLQAAADQGVKRVVLTSSTGAVVYGKEKSERGGVYSEQDWTNTDQSDDVTPYFKSKTLAEKAAWSFIDEQTHSLELATVCPGAILGPVLESDFGTSANIVIKCMDGSIPALPDIGFDMVDVRSVAELLILAMDRPEAANQRFIGTNGYYSFKEVAGILKAHFPDRKIPQRVLPNFMVRLISNFDATLKPILIDLSVEREAPASKAKNVLGWKPIDNEQAVLACAKSALELGLIK
ncbi:MAG: aldehyde reductase [Bacteroidota bacterium]